MEKLFKDVALQIPKKVSESKPLTHMKTPDVKSMGRSPLWRGFVRRRFQSSWTRVMSVAGTAFLVAASVCHVSGQASQAPHYVLIDLGTLGGTSSAGYGINNSGKVTGDSSGHAFLYSGGSMQDLRTLGGPSSGGYGINNSGEVTGYSNIYVSGNIKNHAFLYSGGSMRDLGTLGGPGSLGYGINNSGRVTGISDTTREFSPAFRTLPNSPINPATDELGTLGGTYATGDGINNSGEVTGYSYLPGDGYNHAFLYSGGSMRDLNTLGGSESFGYGINDAGKVTGNSNISGNTASHAFLYSRGSMQDLRTLGGTNSYGYSINNFEQVTGYSNISGNSANHAFLYSKGTMIDLNTLASANSALISVSGYAVNDSGQITGIGRNQDGNQHAYLGTPFYRQVDPPPDVPATFGNGNDQTANTGCALVSSANMCRSLIGLKAKTFTEIMTPEVLNRLLVAKRGYDANNKLLFTEVSKAIASLANVEAFLKIPINTGNYNSVLTNQIYTRGRRVVLKFNHTTTDQTTGQQKTGSHYVWVIGKENSDWKLADPGWNNVAPGQSTRILSSLQSHLNGFTTISARTGHTISHEFEFGFLHAFQNTDHVGPTSAGESKTTGQLAVPQTENTVAAVAIDATGPVALLLTDPQGRRIGRDQFGHDFSEIPNASYFTETPILSPDGDVVGGGGPLGIKIVHVPSPIPGTYTLQATGTATGTSNINLRILGPGGGEHTTPISIQTTPGSIFTHQLVYSDAGAADLSLTQTATPNPASLGGNLTYTMTVTNHGPSTATVPTFTDFLPDNADFVSAQSSSGTCAQSGDVVSCQLNNLPSNSSATVEIVVIPRNTDTKINSANIAAFESDPDGANNTSELSVSVRSSSPPIAHPATYIASNSFTTNWSSVSGATGYRLDVSPSSSFSTYVPGYQNLNVGNATSRNVTGLNASTTYYYRVRAYNGAGASGNSNVVNVTTLSPTGHPVVTTNPATLIASFSATLNGSLDPHGLTTNVRFDYGTTTSYGLTTATQSQTGNTYRNVSASISGLSANTTYHFRIEAGNSAGFAVGGDRTFTTLSSTGPPVVATNPATLIASYSATLNGSVDPHGLGTNVHFQYGTTTSYGSTTAAQNKSGNSYQNVTANISGLSASTTYHFRIVASNSSGTVYGADRTFTTLSATGPPVAITNPATNVTTSTARLNGKVDPHGLDTTVEFEYGTTTNYGFTLNIFGLSGNTYVDFSPFISGLSASTTYHFRIVATNSAGTRYGSDRTFTTQ